MTSELGGAGRILGSLLLCGALACGNKDHPGFVGEVARDGGPRPDGGSGGSAVVQPTLDGGALDGPFTQGGMYLAGTVSADSLCSDFGIAEVNTPHSYSMGFECGASVTDNPPNYGTRPAIVDGALVYFGAGGKLVRYVPDYSGSDPVATVGYPTDPQANDPLIATSACSPTSFLAGPMRRIVYGCANGNFFDGTIGLGPIPGTPLWLGAGNSLLTYAGSELSRYELTSKALTALDGIPSSGTIYTGRASGAGFHLAVEDLGTMSGYEVQETSALKIGDYAAMPQSASAIVAVGAYALGPDDALYQLATLSTGGGGVVRRILNGASEIIYSNADTPLVFAGVGQLITGP